MKKNSLYLIQAAVAALKILLFFVAPLVVLKLPFAGNVFSLKGMQLYHAGAVVCLFMLIVYGVMLLLSFGSTQKLDLIAAAAALIMELVVAFNAMNMIGMEQLFSLLRAIPQVAPYLSVVSDLAKTAFQPGAWLYISIALTVVYAILALISEPAYTSRYTSGSSHK